MAKLGYVATTNPMGAGKWHVGDYTPSLKGADLYIIPDNDDVGRDHAKSVAQAAVKVAKAVHIIDLSKPSGPTKPAQLRAAARRPPRKAAALPRPPAARAVLTNAPAGRAARMPPRWSSAW